MASDFSIKKNWSIPKSIPAVYSTSVRVPMMNAPIESAREAWVLALPECSLRRSMRESPQSMKAMAVFAFMLTHPGPMLVNDPTPNAHPAKTAMPDAVTTSPGIVETNNRNDVFFNFIPIRRRLLFHGQNQCRYKKFYTSRYLPENMLNMKHIYHKNHNKSTRRIIVKLLINNIGFPLFFSGGIFHGPIKIDALYPGKSIHSLFKQLISASTTAFPQ